MILVRGAPSGRGEQWAHEVGCPLQPPYYGLQLNQAGIVDACHFHPWWVVVAGAVAVDTAVAADIRVAADIAAAADNAVAADIVADSEAALVLLLLL